MDGERDLLDLLVACYVVAMARGSLVEAVVGLDKELMEELGISIIQ